MIPKLNHDVLVDVCLHLAHECKINEREIWMAVEDAVIASLH
jgi:hypothetical protein